GHSTRTKRLSSLTGAGCRQPNSRVRRRDKNVLDIPSYRSPLIEQAFTLTENLLTRGQLVKRGCYTRKRQRKYTVDECPAGRDSAQDQSRGCRTAGTPQKRTVVSVRVARAADRTRT